MHLVLKYIDLENIYSRTSIKKFLMMFDDPKFIDFNYLLSSIPLILKGENLVGNIIVTRK